MLHFAESFFKMDLVLHIIHSNINGESNVRGYRSMFIEYYYFKSNDVPVIGLNTNTYNLSINDELFKRLNVINALCFINKGSSLTINFENSYDLLYKKGLFGYKMQNKSKHTSVEDFFSQFKYPSEIELTGTIGDNPKVGDGSFYKTTTGSNPNDVTYYHASKDIYTIKVPESYSSKVYNDLKVRLAVHRSAILTTLKQYTRMAKEGSFIILDTHNSRINCRVDSLHTSDRINFKEFGMDDLPEEIETIVAFSEELVSCCYELYEIEDGDTRSDINIYYDNQNTSGWVKTYMKLTE